MTAVNEPLSEKGLQLEPLRERHTAAFTEAATAAADHISKWLGEKLALRSQEDVVDFISEWKRGWKPETKFGWAAREECNDRIIGFGFLNQVNHSHRFANLGYWVRPDSTRQGYATTITRLLATFAFDRLELVRVELVIEPKNTASRRVAENVGAVQEGLLRNRVTRNGEPHDTLMYSLIPEEAP